MAALTPSSADAAMAYGTDGALAALDLVLMEDSRSAQIVYAPAPVLRAGVLERHLIIGPTLARVFAPLSLNRLQALNAQITVDGRDPRAVAEGHLQSEGLLR
jgi:osmoprotectant transport system substrate-binding protein